MQSNRDRWQAAAAAAALALALLVPLLVPVLVPAGARAQAAALPPLPAEAFFGQPDMAQPVLSPSGRHVAVLMRGLQDRNALAVLDLDDATRSKTVMRFVDADILSVHWVGANRLVFDVIDMQAGSGDRTRAAGLFAVDRDGGNFRELVRLRAKSMVTDGESGVDRRLEYNHVLLHVPRGSDDEVIIGEQVFGNDGWERSLRPLRLNVRTGIARAIVAGAPADVQSWLFDDAGEPRLAFKHQGSSSRIHWRGPGESTWKLLASNDDGQLAWEPHALDAQGGLYVKREAGAAATEVLLRFDFAKGQPEAEPLISTPGFDFAGSAVTDPDSGRTLGWRLTVDAVGTVWLDPAMKALQAEVDKRLPGRSNLLTCAPCSGERRTVLIESLADRDPGTYLVWRAGADKPEALGRARNLAAGRLARMSLERIKARDGRDLPVWVTLPADTSAAGAPPAVVLVHGGPWVRGSVWGWHDLPQFLASRGYVVVEPEFRGSAGYGGAHRRAGDRQWGQAMQNDVADAVLWAAREKLIDPGRVCIAGASYGGYATLMGLVRHPDLYRCGAAWVGVTDLLRYVEGGIWHRDDISSEARDRNLPRLVGDPKADREMLLAHSPLAQAARIRAPVLLAYGEDDRRVPLVHGTDLRAALKMAGNEPEWIVYREEGHGWRRQVNEVDFARRLEAFLGKHLK